MYGVFEDGKAASCRNFPVERKFNNHKFKTFAEALKYAKAWVGRIGDRWDGKVPLELYGSKVEIRKVRK